MRVIIIVMSNSIFCAIVSLCLTFVFSFSASAVTFEVTTADEFQAALATAGGNGAENEIVLSEGVFKGNFKYVAEHGSGLTIRGKGSRKTILDGESRAFVLFFSLSAHAPRIEVSALGITQGSANTGAAIRVASTTAEPFFSWNPELHPEVTLSDLHIYKNVGGTSFRGSIIAGAGSSFLIKNSDLIDNTALYLVDCADSCVVEIVSSQLVGTETFFNGGSRNIVRSGSIILENSVLKDMELDNSYFYGGDQEIGCTLMSSEFLGEGVVGCGSSRAFSVNDTVFGVRAAFGGSGVVRNSTFLDGNITVSGADIEFVGNLVTQPDSNSTRSMSFGGYEKLELLSNTVVHLFLMDLTPEENNASQIVANNIITSKRADGLSPILQNEFPESSKLINNILPAGDYGFWDQDVGNIQAEPSFFDIENEDYHLTLDSIGIDGGNDEYLLDSQDFDLDGNPRVLGRSVDIGAYERSTTELHPADTDGDNSISREEFDAYNLAWRGNDKWTSAPEVITVDFVTRAGFLLQKGGTYKNIGVGKPQTWVPLSD